MDNLYIDYEQGILLGNKLKEESSELKNLLLKFSSMQEKLKYILNGDNDYEVYKNLTTQTQVVDKLLDLISETSNFLINVSDAYKELEYTNENKR